ncbi:MAG: MmcQ/YjbR family DNA-binding protein [Gaiellaceae bacterium]
MTAEAIRDRVRAICLALPDVTEEGDQHLGFSVRGRRFAWFVDDHHGDGRVAIHCKAAPGENTALVSAGTERYFRPPYLAPRGWVGAWLDIEAIDWDRVEGLLVEAYRLAAPQRLAARLDAQG